MFELFKDVILVLNDEYGIKVENWTLYFNNGSWVFTVNKKITLIIPILELDVNEIAIDIVVAMEELENG